MESPLFIRLEEALRSCIGVDDGFRTRDLRIHNPAL
jgi:hypothetical protein